MSDELLVIRCQLGEREAFTELVQGWHPRVERYVGRMLGGPDDDVVQEIWLAVVKGYYGCGGRTGLRRGSSPSRAGR
jgi:DNA-directed RNA polymerase specialized sigma24 family protein